MNTQQSGTPNYMKFLNKKQVLQTIIGNADLFSRADLSKKLDISKPTISNIVDELIQEGWLDETESQVSSGAGGRRPVHLNFNKNAKFIIGVDIGGTLTEIALMNLQGEFLQTSQFDTQEWVKKDFTEKIATEIKSILLSRDLNENQILALAAGAPGITDIDSGVVIEAPSLQWMQYPLQQKLTDYFSFPVYIENDVNIAVLGEQWQGAARGKDNVVLITLGTGVGCGVIVNGELYRGSRFAAGEIGYMITDKNKAKMNYDSMFDGYGFLENHVGGPSIVQEMKNRLKKNVFEEYASIQKWTAKEVFQLAIQGDRIAEEVVLDAIDHFSIALINVTALLNPECIVLGGGLSKSGGWFLPILQEKIQQHLPKQCQTEIYLTQLSQVSLLGTAALCLRNDPLLSL